MTRSGAQEPRGLRVAALEAWKVMERRGAQLLFVAPIFGLPLCVAAYFVLPGAPLPTVVLLVGLLGAMAYLWRGVRRLRAAPAALFMATVLDKRVHQTTNTSTRAVSRWHYFLLEVEGGEGLTRSGRVIDLPPWLEARGELTVTSEIYGRFEVGEPIAAAAFPHDRGIYLALDAGGALIGGPAREPSGA